MSTELIQKIEAEARRYAEMYQPSSDGRNTFIIFADWVASQSDNEAERLREALTSVREEINLSKAPKLLAKIEAALGLPRSP